MVATWALIAAAGLMADGVSMKFVGSGATAQVGGYRPLQAKMDGTADLVKTPPAELAAPKYGELRLDGKSWAFILDEPEGKPAKLYIDTNDDGDLTNDPEVEWTESKSNGLTMYRGEAKIDLGDDQQGTLGLYRFDPNDPRRSQLKNTLMYYTDFGYEVTLNLDGKSHTTFLAGKPEASQQFWIDRDENKRWSYKLETVRLNQPFNFTGTSYVLKLTNGELSLEKASEEVPQAPLPPDISVGKKAIPFEATTLDGAKIDFPKSYAGKLVMLDFWATWCGPCIAELPNVKDAYAEWHDQGFEILGISFDQPGMKDKLVAFTKQHEMPWPQIYEGKGWSTDLGEQYDVSAIPFVLLVDGDTGEILALANQLRGPGLTDVIGKALEKKKNAAAKE
jgi:thiol-disulfide isomerase/thioredoxin